MTQPLPKPRKVAEGVTADFATLLTARLANLKGERKRETLREVMRLVKLQISSRYS